MSCPAELHDAFPFYEILVNGNLLWSWSSKDTGPGFINLNTSERFAVSGTY
jgi:hypothetical protein